MTRLSHAYAEFLATMRRPARYLGTEYGAVHKDWSSVSTRIVLGFPDLYELGMSHLGLRILYSKVNAQPDLLAERVFMADDDLEEALRERGQPLVSLESHRPLRDFDLVGFSLQHELTYTNLLAMLELGGIPLRAAERSPGDPLVIVGGPCALHPEPLAPFVDLVLLGDGEEALPELLRVDGRLRAEGADRRARLAALAVQPGVYAPALYELTPGPNGTQVVGSALQEGLPLPVPKAVLSSLDTEPFPTDGPVALVETTFDRTSVEIARGCAQGCRFCQAGMTYRPLRERAPLSVRSTVSGALAQCGHDEVSLTCLSTADYFALQPLIVGLNQELLPAKVALSVSSLRAYGLPEELLAELARVRTTGLTFAPEAGTQRLRDVINKNVSDQDLDRSAELAYGMGWGKLKLYFMMGLPTETDEDLIGILDTMERVRAIGRRIRGRGAQLQAAVAVFVPRPHTPFQWAAMDPPDALQRKRDLLLTGARQRRLKVRIHGLQASMLEALLARGDRRLADVVEGAYRKGARFDGWDERLKAAAWEEAIVEAGVDAGAIRGAWPVGARLPWDHVGIGVDPGFLEREWARAARAAASPPCAAATLRTDGASDPVRCYACGLECDVAGLRRDRKERLEELGPLPKLQQSYTPRDRGRARRGGRKPPAPAFPQGDVHVYRLHYAKLGPAAFLGHLDVVRALPRVLRRAGLRAFYSQGFHPKPQMTFGPALSLGVASLGEWVDLKLEDELEDVELLERLARAVFSGLQPLEVRRVVPGQARVSRRIHLLEHALLVDDDLREATHATASAAGGLLPWLVTTAQEAEFPAGALVGARWDTAAALDDRFDLPGEQTVLRLLFRFGNGRMLKPRELGVAAGLLPSADPRQELRLACWAERGEQSPELPWPPAGR